MSHYQSGDGYPPTSLRPDKITARPDIESLIYVETAASSLPSSSRMAPPPAQHSDLAGVLRRNQACLNCRRRKLKCDAVRPHCGTCVRSHKHALRTTPKSNPVMACDWDDESGLAPTGSGSGGANGNIGGGASILHQAMDLDGEEGSRDGGGKKKRKSNSGKKREEEEVSRANLVKRIQELEAQIQAKSATTATESSSSGNQSWTSSTLDRPPQLYQSTSSAPSPTALLDLLSSTAARESVQNQPGRLRDGAMDSIMMSGSTGLTPYLTMEEPRLGPVHHSSNATSSMTSESRRASEGATDSSTGPSILSPNGVFNFSPSPITGGSQADPTKASDANIMWATAFNNNNGNAPPMGPSMDSGGLHPSTLTEGPWRGVETAGSIYAATGVHVPIDRDGAPLEQIPMYPPSRPKEQGSGDTFVIPENQDGSVPDEILQQRILMDLFWPGWPPNLPEPNIVNDLIESFFNMVPALPRMLHRPRLLARMALPPTHQNFPHPSLLHAICACASLWCAPAVYSQSTMANNIIPGIMSMPGADRYAKFTSTPAAPTFSSTQADLAKASIYEGLDKGHKLFDIVRAMIVLSRVFIDETRMLECWTVSGLVARMILPLGLNVRSAELSLKSVMLPPPVDALEREERRTTVWMAFYHDTIGSTASGWGTSMSIDELTIPLPVAAKDFDLGSPEMESNPQDIESLDLWTRHPVVDPFVLCMKAVIILNRVTRFVRKWKNRHIRDDDDLEGMNRPEFRELANAISCFQMSFPPSHRNPMRPGPKGRLDIDLISAHLIPHMCTICLYEPFGDITDPTDPCTRRLTSATSAIVSIIQEIAARSGTNADFSTIMHSSASVSLVTAARTSVVFYRHALNLNDHTAAETHRMDIELIRMALAQFGTRFKIGFHHAQLIEYFLDRATNPTFEKLAAHYPDHPRPGAPELHPGADFGRCIINALNIKRGYWRVPRLANSNQAPSGISPFGSTPESMGQGSGSTAGTSGSSAYNNNNNNKQRGPSNDNSPNSNTGANPFTEPPLLDHGASTGTGMPMGTGCGIGMGVGGGPNSDLYLAKMMNEANASGGLQNQPPALKPASSVYAWTMIMKDLQATDAGYPR